MSEEQVIEFHGSQVRMLRPKGKDAYRLPQSMGPVKNDRVTLIEWCETKQAWFIAWTKEGAEQFGYKPEEPWGVALPKEALVGISDLEGPNGRFFCCKPDPEGEKIGAEYKDRILLWWDEYEDANRAEILVIQGLQMGRG